jgi:hypothetical protein
MPPGSAAPRAGALVVLPLLSTEPVDPRGAVVPASIWKLVVLVMAAGVAGQVAIRLGGTRFGLRPDIVEEDPLHMRCRNARSEAAMATLPGSRRAAS